MQKQNFTELFFSHSMVFVLAEDGQLYEHHANKFRGRQFHHKHLPNKDFYPVEELRGKKVNKVWIVESERVIFATTSDGKLFEIITVDKDHYKFEEAQGIDKSGVVEVTRYQPIGLILILTKAGNLYAKKDKEKQFTLVQGIPDKILWIKSSIHVVFAFTQESKLYAFSEPWRAVLGSVRDPQAVLDHLGEKNVNKIMTQGPDEIVFKQVGKFDFSKSGIKELYIYKSSVYLIDKDGDLYVWGDNHSGQLGLGKVGDHVYFPLRAYLPDQDKAISVRCEASGSCVFAFLEGESGKTYISGENPCGSYPVEHNSYGPVKGELPMSWEEFTDKYKNPNYHPKAERTFFDDKSLESLGEVEIIRKVDRKIVFAMNTKGHIFVCDDTNANDAEFRPATFGGGLKNTKTLDPRIDFSARKDDDELGLSTFHTC